MTDNTDPTQNREFGKFWLKRDRFFWPETEHIDLPPLPTPDVLKRISDELEGGR